MNTLTEKEIEGVQNILMEQLNVKRDQLKPEASLGADLMADSLDAVEISMKLEEMFGLSIPDNLMDQMQTVGEIYEGLSSLRDREIST